MFLGVDERDVDVYIRIFTCGSTESKTLELHHVNFSENEMNYKQSNSTMHKLTDF
jgi:hypothetical protein